MLFLLGCLAGAGWMRVLVRHGVLGAHGKNGAFALVLCTGLALVALRRWRYSDPNRCAAVIGVCGGIGGAGLAMLMSALRFALN